MTAYTDSVIETFVKKFEESDEDRQIAVNLLREIGRSQRNALQFTAGVLTNEELAVQMERWGWTDWSGVLRTIS